MPLDSQILGQGVYTPREAARLARTNAQQVLRWTRGSGTNEPLWHAHFQYLDEDTTEISFLDLVEVRVVAAMRKKNISLQSIRFAISFAQQKFGIERPLASQKFKTVGTEILMEAVESDGEYVSLAKNRPGQKVFREIIAQSLNDLEYENQVAVRWRPKGFSNVVIDPNRHFGDPILDQFGISTNTIYNEFKDFKDLNYLSCIYEIPKGILNAGILFEKSLDEANG
ncbi:hypothetical protein [Thalassovita taeanensis]|uniref:DUF433 domain-containing protein n=1 Tax=Thalassovita taeanensis TaxID=657014 RepID=A0A1H9D7S5_9RHOB|nr:hypothetical protein [Thalassovita taeanensis]SEQ09494.1 hypothetical protein SAMN04488092_10444 [Thalassovita taeanensis]